MRKTIDLKLLLAAVLVAMLIKGACTNTEAEPLVVNTTDNRIELEVTEVQQPAIQVQPRTIEKAEPEYIPSTEAAEGYISELRLIEITEEIGNAYGICPELLQAIAERESTLYIKAVNGTCKGLMQVNITYMAERMERLEVEDVYDEYGNILLAADLLAELRDTTKHGDDVYYVLMRYNMRTDTANELYEAGTISNYAKEVVARANELERLHGN